MAALKRKIRNKTVDKLIPHFYDCEISLKHTGHNLTSCIQSEVERIKPHEGGTCTWTGPMQAILKI